MILEQNKTYEFAIRWIEKFKKENIDFLELVDHFIADEFEKLGFKMDCGDAFGKQYGKAVYDNRELVRIIDSIDDINLLGSAIYSRWRYFNHWAFDAAEILNPQNRDWFITALERLSILASIKPSLFYGTPQKIRIVLNGIYYGPCPEPDDIVEQHITINAQGRVWYSSYKFGYGNPKYEKAESKNFKIDKELASKVLTSVVSYFMNNETDMFITDVGSWDIKITNTENKAFNFSGCLCSDYEVDFIDVLKFIHEVLRVDDLFL